MVRPCCAALTPSIRAAAGVGKTFLPHALGHTSSHFAGESAARPIYAPYAPVGETLQIRTEGSDPITYVDVGFRRRSDSTDPHACPACRDDAIAMLVW